MGAIHPAPPHLLPHLEEGNLQAKPGPTSSEIPRAAQPNGTPEPQQHTDFIKAADCCATWAGDRILSQLQIVKRLVVVQDSRCCSQARFHPQDKSMPSTKYQVTRKTTAWSQ